ncbi:hypothetical protein CAEBREN_11026 [Caenorhabditis brenneri]|uniref:Uncharacterized protein n=1 Tax=Caenorhabditis brenneri TaxID=135651 RepID=G0MFX7_CAEBE|nr:hypothetical protein CAEBREN_11026 [Caenorhabditis brenneri]
MHNNQYSRGYGYNEQSTSSSSSSRSSDRIHDRFNSWHKEPEWSGRDESWRGNSRPVAPPDRGRNDSWKTASASPTTLGFQLGRDRAPMPVDDQFLIRYGAKRLSNGNLVDRDGYTLRTRDPNCRAPSPPAFNPGREMRRNGDNGRDRGGPPSPNRSSGGSWERMRPDEDLEKKARQQIEMMEKLEEESKKAAEKRMIEKRKAKEKEKRKEKDGEDEWEEPEGQDEYEDVIEEPPEKKEAKNIPPFTKSPLLPNPPPFLSGGPRFNGPTYQKAKPAPRPDSWFSQYKKNVEAFKEQLYRAPPVPPPAAPGYYPNDRHSTLSGSSPAFPRTSASPSTSSPYPAQPRRQMDLPPPGVVEFDPVYSKRSPRYTGVDHGRIATASTSSAYPMAVNAFGVYIGNQNPPSTSSQPRPTPAIPPSTNRRDSPSSDSGSGSEDEAIRKLREIIKNYGSRT